MSAASRWPRCGCLGGQIPQETRKCGALADPGDVHHVTLDDEFDEVVEPAVSCDLSPALGTRSMTGSVSIETQSWQHSAIVELLLPHYTLQIFGARTNTLPAATSALVVEGADREAVEERL